MVSLACHETPVAEVILGRRAMNAEFFGTPRSSSVWGTELDSEQLDAVWCLNSVLVNLPYGGIVHGYPGARFLRALRDRSGRIAVSFWIVRRGRDLSRSRMPTRWEYMVRIFGSEEEIPNSFGAFVDCFEVDGASYVAFAEPL